MPAFRPPQLTIATYRKLLSQIHSSQLPIQSSSNKRQARQGHGGRRESENIRTRINLSTPQTRGEWREGRCVTGAKTSTGGDARRGDRRFAVGPSSPLADSRAPAPAPPAERRATPTCRCRAPEWHLARRKVPRQRSRWFLLGPGWVGMGKEEVGPVTNQRQA